MHPNDNGLPCPADQHDFAPSPSEAMILVCSWPGCTATRAASPAPVIGVDLPTAAVEAVVFARAA